FGRLTIGPNQSLHLYGTPGQMRFDFMWDILIRFAHAYILLVDVHRPDNFRYNRRILNFMSKRVQIPMLVGLTHADCSDAWDIEDVVSALGLKNSENSPPFVIVNPNDKSSVFQSLITLIDELMKTTTLQ
ncbi:MAG: ATP/GTP-binding protein, partial [Sphaerospermopsis sp.]|nr:ATP/GTP-binding protein [Sphaerospermopsis sp.]